MTDNLDRATPRICDDCGEPLGNSVHWIGGEPGVFHDGCLAKRMYLRAPAAEIDRLRAQRDDMLAALKVAEKAIDDCLNFRSHLNYDARDVVRAAIAKAAP